MACFGMILCESAIFMAEKTFLSEALVHYMNKYTIKNYIYLELLRLLKEVDAKYHLLMLI